jgi:hypothetical protein
MLTENTYIGHEAGANAFTGTTGAVGIGYRAGYATAGIRSTFLGALSRIGGAINQTATDCVFIGYGSGGDLSGAQTNRLRVQNNNSTLIDGYFTPTDRQILLNGGLQALRTAHVVTGNVGEETVVGCTTSNITKTILSAQIARSGRIFLIKDESGTAGAGSPITIETEGAETIDGQANAQIVVPYGIARLYSDGSNLFSW